MQAPCHRITVLGGSSVGTPILIEQLARGCRNGQLPPIDLCLFGRSAKRLERVADHGRYRCATLIAGADHTERLLQISTTLDLQRALDGTEIILCQVRPNGMAGRAADEMLAIEHGIPGDEGLGPSGLSCFLKGRPTMDALLESIALRAPRALLLQMTSPLGLQVARARQAFSLRCFGVCELPAATTARVLKVVEPKLGVGPLQVMHGGLNHQAWLHVFLDSSGVNRTAEVLDAIDDPALVSVDPEIIQMVGAVPLPYLRLYYHSEREWRRQAKRRTRGAELIEWSARADAAYLRGSGCDHEEVQRILGERQMNWYEQGVVTTLAAVLSDTKQVISLNLPNGGALADIEADAVVEVPCAVSHAQVEPITVPPLPPGPLALVQRLVQYERSVLSLSGQPGELELSATLRLHPLVHSDQTAGNLARAILAQS